MSRPVRRLARWAAALGAAITLAACGGGGGSDAPAAPAAASGDTTTSSTSSTPAATAANVLAVQVDRGTDGSTINTPYVTVTVCLPGGSVCQAIDHVIVDTGSSGLRIAASALPAALQLPGVSDAAGAPVGECAHFASGFAWGSVHRADVRLAGATAANVPVHVVDNPTTPFAAVPAECSATGADIGPGQGARGILGVGLFDEDCGRACEVSGAPSIYFACTGGNCAPTTLAQTSQVRNPVAALPADNNGVVLVLPDVAGGGTPALAGSLILGVGTQPNNQLGSATVHATDARGFFNTVYRGATLSGFLDSGSNGIFFADPDIPRCGDFYCPPAPLALSATDMSAGGVSTTVDFTIDPVNQLVPGAAAARLGGDGGAGRTFDWGLPFFFGRTVFVARAGAQTPAGAGPYWAW